MDYKDFLYLHDIEIELENQFDNIAKQTLQELNYDESIYSKETDDNLILPKLDELKLDFSKPDDNDTNNYYLTLLMSVKFYNKSTKALIQTNPQLSIKRSLLVDTKYMNIDDKVLHHDYIENIISTIVQALKKSVIYKYNFQKFNFDKYFDNT
ncbi:hypothetical protein [Staphylococcus aureus]|uniref:hypothetical protein n=1 Tax=Staphylococcaceae TaxID=90964 RepID=UPI00044EF552|nr:hypothetical protein [Staphylococcus aureus]EZV57641.1 hypothetical protein V074_02596 [Staphylococcus aureus 2010-60-1240-1]EZX74394.1 hypothetical protein V110_02678 [Staphylococcus aureus Chi-8]MBZ5281924.1 hypothetical protein [Staphylococcus aureus]MDG6736534.1 hypothetical protein [Staphylococcus aureus]HDE3760417.1 hypothetical protein [Staphylococcus aureus]